MFQLKTSYRITSYNVCYTKLLRDNIRHDVLLSPDFCKSIGNLVYQLFLKHVKAKKILNIDPTSNLVTERDEFKHLCRDVLHAAINQAKSGSEIQIDQLAQIVITSYSIHYTKLYDWNEVKKISELDLV